MGLHVIVGAGPVGAGTARASRMPGTRSGPSPAAGAARRTRASRTSRRTRPGPARWPHS